MISGRSTGPLERGPGHAALLAAALVSCVVAALLVTSTPASAQQLGPSDRVGLRLTSITGVLGPGGVPIVDVEEQGSPESRAPVLDLQLRMLVENRGDAPIEQLRTIVEVLPAVESRHALHDALSGGPLPPAIHVHDTPVRDGGPLAPGAIAGVEERYVEGTIPWASGGGVHPLRISILRGAEVLAELVTAIVWLEETPTDPLRTVLVWPIDTEPTRAPGGVYPAEAESTYAPGGRVDVLLRALERSPSAGVVLAPAPHLLEDLHGRSDGYLRLETYDGERRTRPVEPEDPEARHANDTLQRLRKLAGSLPYAPVPAVYAGSDLASLLQPGGSSELRELASVAAGDGARRMQALLDTGPDPTTHLLDQPVPVEALDLLPARNVLLAAGTTTEQDASNAAPRALAAADTIRAITTPAGRTLTAFVADPWLSRTLSDPDPRRGPVAVVQDVVASTAMAALERPEGGSGALLVLPSPSWDPGPHIAESVLEQLSEATWLELTHPSSTAVDRPVRPVELADAPGVLDRDLTDRIARVQRELHVLPDALPDGIGDVDGHSFAELEDTLLRATSSWLAGAHSATADELVASVADSVDAMLGEIEVTEARVTLTSDTGQIPVTLERTDGGPLLVRVEIASQGRLTWPDGRQSEILALEPGNRHTVTFSARALSTGTFPVTVRVTDPHGRHELAGAVLSVRSTAISGPALGAMGGVVLALLAVGVLRRRDADPRLRVVTGPEDARRPGSSRGSERDDARR